MKTKNIIVLIAGLMLASITLQAQVSFGVRAGVNFQNINGKDDDGDQLENDLITGFNVGANVEIPVGTDIYFQPGLLFSTKGAKSDTSSLIGTITQTLNLSYIEVPLNIVFKPALGTGNMLLGFGPYVAYGIGGKAKLEGPGITNEWDVEFKNELTVSDLANDAVYMKAFDAGANFLIGYEMANRLSLQLNAQLGLLNINPEIAGIDDDSVYKNTGFGLSIGYRF